MKSEDIVRTGRRKEIMSKQRNSPKEALQRLQEGNERFTNGLKSIESFLNLNKLRELAVTGQNPFAVVLTCSDSRVPAEIIFDQGLGDLFVIRVAGNVLEPSLVASTEFAVANFGVGLVVVMGHTQCGAVQAAIDYVHMKKAPPTSSLAHLIEQIVPAVQSASALRTDAHDHLHLATLANIQRSVGGLYMQSRILRNKVESGELHMTGALFDLHSGRVAFHESDVQQNGLNQADNKSRNFKSHVARVN
jgi:carbonic anhydrase